MRARGAANRIEAQNQFLPLSTQLLNDQDLHTLSTLLTGPEKDTDIVLLLRVMLATSSNVDRAERLQIVSADEFVGDVDSGYWQVNSTILI